MWSVARRSGERRDAIEDARLVEMEMAFDEPRRHETAARIRARAVAGDARLDGGDASVRDRDIDVVPPFASRALRKIRSKATFATPSS